MFHTDLIACVLRKNATVELHPFCMVQAIGKCINLLLNVYNIVRPFIVSARNGSQAQLLARVANGALSADWSECVEWDEAASSKQSINGECGLASACACLEVDARHAASVILIWAECAILAGSLGLAAWHFAMRRRGWISVAHGFGYLDAEMTTSAIKILPRVKEAPSHAAHSFKTMRTTLTEDDGLFSVGDRLYVAGYLLVQLCAVSLVSSVGIFALYFKLDSLVYLFDVPLGRWRARRWLRLVGFANQLAGLVPLEHVKKEAFLRFVFTGEDGELQPTEQSAMDEFLGTLHHSVFRACTPSWRGLNLKGVVATLSINVKDLQAIVISELTPKAERARRRSCASDGCASPARRRRSSL